jgi:hypothetical protein
MNSSGESASEGRVSSFDVSRQRKRIPRRVRTTLQLFALSIVRSGVEPGCVSSGSGMLKPRLAVVKRLDGADAGEKQQFALAD